MGKTRGRSKPRISEDPDEDRMMTWRLKGRTLNLLTEVCRAINVSHNKFVDLLMRKNLKAIKRRLDKGETIDELELLNTTKDLDIPTKDK